MSSASSPSPVATSTSLLAEPTLQLLGPSGHVKRGHRRRASLRGRVRLQPQFRAALATPRRGRPVSLPNRIESLLYEQPERRVERHDLGRKVGVREPSAVSRHGRKFVYSECGSRSSIAAHARSLIAAVVSPGGALKHF